MDEEQFTFQDLETRLTERGLDPSFIGQAIKRWTLGDLEARRQINVIMEAMRLTGVITDEEDIGLISEFERIDRNTVLSGAIRFDPIELYEQLKREQYE